MTRGRVRSFEHYFTQSEVNEILCDFSMKYGVPFHEHSLDTLTIVLHSRLNEIIRMDARASLAPRMKDPLEPEKGGA